MIFIFLLVFFGQEIALYSMFYPPYKYIYTIADGDDGVKSQ